jgi:4a-hydroxytetrahydrobiopterin dehydratase
MPEVLSADAVAGELTGLDGWNGDTSSISRTVTLADDQRDALVQSLQGLAREMNHDPDLDYTEGAMTITMSTHSAGGVTELDVEYARRANALIAGLAS